MRFASCVFLWRLLFSDCLLFDVIADVSLLAELNHLGGTLIIKMLVCSVCTHFFAIVRASKYNPVNKTNGLKQVMKVLLYEIWCWIRLNAYPCPAPGIMQCP